MFFLDQRGHPSFFSGHEAETSLKETDKAQVRMGSNGIWHLMSMIYHGNHGMTMENHCVAFCFEDFGAIETNQTNWIATDMIWWTCGGWVLFLAGFHIAATFWLFKGVRQRRCYWKKSLPTAARCGWFLLETGAQIISHIVDFTLRSYHLVMTLPVCELENHRAVNR